LSNKLQKVDVSLSLLQLESKSIQNRPAKNQNNLICDGNSGRQVSQIVFESWPPPTEMKRD
jgi:hypothetical protein